MATMTEKGYQPKVTLGGIYNGLPQRQRPPKVVFVERMAEACCCSTQTIRMWLAGAQKPKPIVQNALLDALVRYGYIESRDNVDLNAFFPIELKDNDNTD